MSGEEGRAVGHCRQPYYGFLISPQHKRCQDMIFFKDLILRRGPLRRTCNPELQVLHWVPCKVAYVGCSIPLDLEVILFGVHRVRYMAESQEKINDRMFINVFKTFCFKIK